VTYRDDRDADQARIAALEGELADARGKLEELEGRRSQALVLARPAGALVAAGQRDRAETWLGAPLRLELTHVFDRALPSALFEDLLPPIREVTGDHGSTELLRSSFRWSGSPSASMNGGRPATVVSVRVRDDRTELVVTERLGAIAGALFGALGGGLGSVSSVGPILASVAVPVLAPVFILGWLGGIYGTTRWLYRRTARRHARRLQALFERLITEIDALLDNRE
jgi:hypothetical protein